MAKLKKCNDCNAQVSKNAESCPRCGAVIKKKSSNMGFGSLVVVIVLGYIGYDAINEIRDPDQSSPQPVKKQLTKEEIAENAIADRRYNRTVSAGRIIKDALKAPDTLKWDKLLANDDASVICMQYRAQNGFGGISQESIVFVNGSLEDESNAWNNHCINKVFFDMKFVRNVIR